MNTRAHSTLHLPLLIAGIAAVLVGALAATPLATSIQSAAEGFKNFVASDDSPDLVPPPVEEAPAKAALEGRAKARCEECAVIESTWELEPRSEKTGADAHSGTAAGKQRETGNSPTKTYETLVRLQDGSTLVINDAYPAARRPGERVKLILGTE